jgi:hypothetical protein
MFNDEDYNIYEAAEELVNTQSPASSDEDKIWMTNKLVEIALRENECIERAWMISSYWND